jgi:hypothetical protein
MRPDKPVNLINIFFFDKKIRNLAGVQNIVYVFQERFIGNLHICENEGDFLHFSPC